MSELHITFYAEKPLILPIAHQQALQAMLFHVLSVGDPFMSQMLHNSKPTLHQRSYAPFVFSRLRGKKAVQGKQIIYEGELRFTLRSCSETLLDTWQKGFCALPSVTLLHQQLLVTNTVRTDYPDFHSPIRIRMQTPMILHRTDLHGQPQFLSPFDPDFSEYATANYTRKWKSLNRDLLPGKIHLSPLQITEKHRCITRYKQATLCGWYGNYMLSAPPQAIRFLLDTGMGERNSQGFGFFTIES